MTLEEVLGDERLRRREFPIVREETFLAHAGVCPLPRKVAEAIKRYAGECTRGDQEEVWPPGMIEKTRELAAKLIGARAHEIAFVGPTSLALSFIAAGVAFKPGDNILIYRDDYPSNVYPWMALEAEGVEVRPLRTEALGQIRLEDVQARVDSRTRLVALASCHFVSGFRIDYESIGHFLHERGILFSLDAIQTLGAFPIQAEHVDFLAADAHKWLLGPCGAGILYVSELLQDALRPSVYGWNNIRCPDYVAQESIVYRRGARRYEAGTYNLMGLAGLRACLEILLEVGVENIARELLRKRQWLVSEIQSRDYTILNAEAPESNQSGIISFYRPGRKLDELFETLSQNQIRVSLRKDRSGQQYLRISPHFYNTGAEFEKLLYWLK